MRWILVALLGLSLAGCATPGVVSSSAPELYRGVLAADALAADSFADANSLARQADTERLLLEAEMPGTALPTIGEKDFTEIVSPEAAAQWRALFDGLAGYAQNLVSLTDPALGAGVGTQLTETGNSLKVIAGNSPALGQAAGLAGVLGGAIVQAAGEKKALAVMTRTDPAFHDLLTGMADAIGRTPDEGLQETVASSWNNAILQVDRTRYGTIPRGPASTGARRAVIDTHLKHVAARDESLGQLASLRQSLLALAAAHRAIVQKRDLDARAWIARIEQLGDDVAAQLKAK